jgi:putative FmdB family regulatory protein
VPIYEYACSKCRTVFQFWTQRIGDPKIPECPKCGRVDMKRLLSSFAIGKGGASSKNEPSLAESSDRGDSSMPDPFAHMSPDQQERAEREMMKLMSQADGLDENNPRQMGAFMRKMTEASGVDFGPEMNEAIRRLERGEDPEKIEEEMGDLFGEMMNGEPGAAPGSGGGWSYDNNLYDL